MKNCSQQIENYTNTKFGLSANQFMGTVAITFMLAGLLNVIHVVLNNVFVI
jgi:hypothetical protein